MRTLPSASVISSSETLDSDTRSIRVFSLRRSMEEAPGFLGCGGRRETVQAPRQGGRPAARAGAGSGRVRVERPSAGPGRCGIAEVGPHPAGMRGTDRREALEAADMHGYREFLEEAPTLRAFRFKSISDATNLRSGRNRPDGVGGAMMPRGASARKPVGSISRLRTGGTMRPDDASLSFPSDRWRPACDGSPRRVHRAPR